jgi:hypothetical protein
MFACVFVRVCKILSTITTVGMAPRPTRMTAAGLIMIMPRGCRGLNGRCGVILERSSPQVNIINLIKLNKMK